MFMNTFLQNESEVQMKKPIAFCSRSRSLFVTKFNRYAKFECQGALKSFQFPHYTYKAKMMRFSDVLF